MLRYNSGAPLVSRANRSAISAVNVAVPFSTAWRACLDTFMRRAASTIVSLTCSSRISRINVPGCAGGRCRGRCTGYFFRFGSVGDVAAGNVFAPQCVKRHFTPKLAKNYSHGEFVSWASAILASGGLGRAGPARSGLPAAVPFRPEGRTLPFGITSRQPSRLPRLVRQPQASVAMGSGLAGGAVAMMLLAVFFSGHRGLTRSPLLDGVVPRLVPASRAPLALSVCGSSSPALRSARSLIAQHRRSASALWACPRLHFEGQRLVRDLFYIIDVVHGGDRNVESGLRRQGSPLRNSTRNSARRSCVADAEQYPADPF